VESSGDVIAEDAQMLRRIDPGSAPLAEAVGIDLELAWGEASRSIVETHNRLADPRAEAQSLGPAQRFALDLLRDPTVALPVGAARADEALSVERSSTVRRALGAIRHDLETMAISPEQAAERIVGVVDDFGLHAVPATPPLTPIVLADIGVVCWMYVLPAPTGESDANGG
jgi:hypothetical protein